MPNKMWLNLFFHETYWFAELISLSFQTSLWDISIELAECICCNEADAYFLSGWKIIYFAFELIWRPYIKKPYLLYKKKSNLKG